MASLPEVVGLLESLPDVGTQLWYSDSDVPEWSDNLFRLLGYEPGEIAPSHDALRDHVHPLDRAETDGNLGPAAKGPAEVAFRIVRTDGEVRHVRSKVRPPADRSRTDTGGVIQVIRDVTDLTHLSRAAAAHVAVSNALADWDGLESGGRRLIRGLAEALGFYRGGLWVPRGDVLLARVFWQREPDTGVFDALSLPRLPAGSGVAGAAWEARAPVSITDNRDPRLQPFRNIGDRESIRGAVGIPALAGDETLAVLAFVSHEEMPLSEGLMRSFTAIANDVGRFLDRRRGQLESAPLTRRQQEVFALAADGMSSAQIAERLGIKPGTVASHFEHAYTLLGAHNRAAAVARALRLGLID
ncbi:MAG TPA: LuxR C-terminal-related transcriptional regulator [Solirubrobacteraceae bacterium]|nr:LuxR C-terminal-related transcriptional regulator [Solirubrobacteraceae bacterium]